MYDVFPKHECFTYIMSACTNTSAHSHLLLWPDVCTTCCFPRCLKMPGNLHYRTFDLANICVTVALHITVYFIVIFRPHSHWCSIQPHAGNLFKSMTGGRPHGPPQITLHSDPCIRLAQMYTPGCTWKSMQVHVSGHLSLISTSYLHMAAWNIHVSHTTLYMNIQISVLV